ncbi:ABC transporter substrate-binding protein [Phyllobacterium sp. SB3]|uniref:ABC transporter substrate-binding protein n=1 Tax=Phyllobacterium sp. SB3 TaxID=3156073 RepID=UPI0032AFC5B2
MAGNAAATSPGRRLVTLDLLPTELLLTLGICPVAVGNSRLYRRLVAEPELTPDVLDLGPLTEPNAELLQSLRPDAILVAKWQAGALEPLKRIAPLIPVAAVSRDLPGVALALQVMEQIATLTGTQEAARNWAVRLEQELQTATEQLEKRRRRPVYVCRFAEDGRNVALFGGYGLIGDVLGRIGLENAWTGRVNASGVTSAGIDSLAENPDAHIVHFDRGRETRKAIERLQDSSLWRALPAVRAGRVTAMPVIYPSGGVCSAVRLARQLAKVIPHDG